MRKRESEQRAAARDEPGMREQEQSTNTVRRAITREEPGVQEHESEQRAAARDEPGVREQEQSTNTVRHALEVGLLSLNYKMTRHPTRHQKMMKMEQGKREGKMTLHHPRHLKVS